MSDFRSDFLPPLVSTPYTRFPSPAGSADSRFPTAAFYKPRPLIYHSRCCSQLLQSNCAPHNLTRKIARAVVGEQKPQSAACCLICWAKSENCAFSKTAADTVSKGTTQRGKRETRFARIPPFPLRFSLCTLFPEPLFPLLGSAFVVSKRGEKSANKSRDKRRE